MMIRDGCGWVRMGAHVCTRCDIQTREQTEEKNQVGKLQNAPLGQMPTQQTLGEKEEQAQEKGQKAWQKANSPEG